MAISGLLKRRGASGSVKMGRAGGDVGGEA